MKESIVLYPAPVFHHMVSMVELGKLILRHHHDLSITILVPTGALDAAATSSYIHQLSQTDLPISFFTLRSIQFPQSLPQNRSAAAFQSIQLNAEAVVDALGTISATSKVLALITSAVHSSYHPHIPTYYYFSSCASTLAFFLHLPTIHNQTSKSFKDLNDTVFHLPGLPPIKASDMPDPVLDRNQPPYHYFIHYASCLPNSKGFIVNTFEALESQAIKAITDGTCVLDGGTPPIYHIGPLITDSKVRAIGYEDLSTECSTWLDAQPSQSVVFLCFGSKGVLSEVQLKELAMGLERSSHRFLWVVRNPKNLEMIPDLEVLLPKGFLERTKDRGLVVKSWAPQSAILSHESVGGFVTHCGWNSVVEAVSYGVPMVAWPLYAEQKMNSVVLVEEMRLAIALEKVAESSSSLSSSSSSTKEEMVSAEELKKKVRELMGQEGQGLRERSLAMKSMAMAAWSMDGSSLSSLSKMVASWKQGH
ncbi:UDP-glycosyltransferase 88F3 [Ziziphus jujuba]|uniref:Glycosyltransferase n=1 Tax=Ziziphus jujuba TaxID=326968 RepID=A0A6P3ZKZ8_ZIZJJ|nr:UDP-glycosyltransferase 88F3 [Ziziphus jujuba]